MAEFKNLKDISNTFEKELRQTSAELFSAKIGDSLEDEIAKKMKDLSLFTSKLRLLQAKPVTVSPQITQQQDIKSTIASYGDTATWKIIEQLIVKYMLQSHAVRVQNKESITTRDLDLADRKQKVVDQMNEYRLKEAGLRNMESVLLEKEETLITVREQWEKELADLRAMKKNVVGVEAVEASGPSYKKLQILVNKMEIMRLLMAKLATARIDGYDWMNDSHRRLNVLKVARKMITVSTFTDSD